MSVLKNERLTIDEIKNGLEEHKRDCLRCREKICKSDSRGFFCLQNTDIRACEELKQYRELQEQGLLLRLPCKVGDTVYQICDGFIEPCTVETIFIGNYVDRNGKYGNMAEIHYDREDYPWVSTEIYFTDIGKTIFLTKSEAEEKLRELEEK